MKEIRDMQFEAGKDVQIEMWRIYKSAEFLQFKPHKKEWSNGQNWFQYYKIKSADEMTNWISYSNKKFPPDEYEDKLIVDMGCGWGLYSLLCHMQGAKKVYAIGPDIRVDFLEEIVKRLGLGNGIVTKKLHFDIATKKIVDERVDVIIGNEFIEHLTSNQRTSFFKAAYNNLNSNGLLLLHTHNTDNRRILKRAKTHWQQQENKHFIKKRQEIIADEFPELNNEEFIALAKRTYGMNKEEILEVCREYVKHETMPTLRYDICAIDPESGIAEENYISPRDVQYEMKLSGFTSRIYPWLGSSFIGKLLYPYGYYIPFFLIKLIVKSITFDGVKK